MSNFAAPSLPSSSASLFAPVAAPHRACNGKVSLDPDELNLSTVRRSVKCVLLSADHPFCILVRSYLQHLGFCVFTCSSADRAEQQFLERRDIDLWVVDADALGADAMCLASRVRDLHAELPIVVISGAGQEECVPRTFSWQGWIRIRKPIQLPDLLAIIQRALAKTPAPLQFVPLSSWDAEPVENDWVNRMRQNHLMN